MSSTRQKLLACLAVSTLMALPLACSSESPETSGQNTVAFEAPRVCGAIVALACEQDQMCQLPVGSCDKPDTRGRCVAIPELCPKILAPVCGCDNVTYTNACEAMRNGVNIAYERACGPFLCGGAEGLPCAQNQYCAAADCDSIGFCVDRPETCDRLGTPVCGCDRKTYDSSCAAHLAGVTVLANNACPVVPWVPSAAPELKPSHSIAKTPAAPPLQK